MPIYGQSYWARRAVAPKRASTASSLKGALTADVVVIGGGLTGCAAAYALARAGHDVILVEADRLASGATQGAMGLVLPAPEGLFTAIQKSAGKRVAHVAFAEVRRSAKDLAATLKRLGVRCDLSSTTLAVNAPFTGDAAALKKDAAARKTAGLDAPWLTATASRDLLATETQGAVRLRDASVLDPVRAALGFAAAAKKKGARIFEQSRVKKTTFTRKEVTVVLANATIAARGVVVATGQPGAVFHQLERHVRVVQGYGVVTEPLTPAMRRAVGPRQALYTEATESPRWLRWLPDHRAMFSGLSGPTPAPALRQKAIVHRANQLMYELSLRYPDISGLPPAVGWDLPVVTTVDGLPWIGPHRNYPFHFFSLAFGWHGEAFAWLAARAAVRHFEGKATKDDELLGFARTL